MAREIAIVRARVPGVPGAAGGRGGGVRRAAARGRSGEGAGGGRDDRLDAGAGGARPDRAERGRGRGHAGLGGQGSRGSRSGPQPRRRDAGGGGRRGRELGRLPPGRRWSRSWSGLGGCCAPTASRSAPAGCRTPSAASIWSTSPTAPRCTTRCAARWSRATTTSPRSTPPFAPTGSEAAGRRCRAGRWGCRRRPPRWRRPITSATPRSIVDDEDEATDGGGLLGRRAAATAGLRRHELRRAAGLPGGDAASSRGHSRCGARAGCGPTPAGKVLDQRRTLRAAMRTHGMPLRAVVATAQAGAAKGGVPVRRVGLDGAVRPGDGDVPAGDDSGGTAGRGVCLRHPADPAHALSQRAGIPAPRCAWPPRRCPTGAAGRGSASRWRPTTPSTGGRP